MSCAGSDEVSMTYTSQWKPESHSTMAMYQLWVRWMLASTHRLTLSGKETYDPLSWAKFQDRKQLSKSCISLKIFHSRILCNHAL